MTDYLVAVDDRSGDGLEDLLSQKLKSNKRTLPANEDTQIQWLKVTGTTPSYPDNFYPCVTCEFVDGQWVEQALPCQLQCTDGLGMCPGMHVLGRRTGPSSTGIPRFVVSENRPMGWVKIYLPGSTSAWTQSTGVGDIQIMNQAQTEINEAAPGFVFDPTAWDNFGRVKVYTKNRLYYLIKDYRYWGHMVGVDSTGTPVWVVDGSSFTADLQLIGQGITFQDNGAYSGTTTGVVQRLCVEVGNGLSFGGPTFAPESNHNGGPLQVNAPSTSGIIADGAGVRIDPTQGLVGTIPYVASASLTSSTVGGVTSYSLSTVTKNIRIYANAGSAVTWVDHD